MRSFLIPCVLALAVGPACGQDDEPPQRPIAVPNFPDEKQFEEMLERLPPEAREMARLHYERLRGGRGGFDGTRQRLGAMLERPTDVLVEQLDLPRGQGLVVGEVKADSAAAKAGLKKYDILLELDGKPVGRDPREFVEQMAKIKENTPVNALVLRKGKQETIKGLSLPKQPAREDVVPGLPERDFPAFPPLPMIEFPDPGAAFPRERATGVLTTVHRTNDRFVARHQEGTLVLTLTGEAADGKAKVKEIRVRDGRDGDTYETLDKVPEAYRDKVKSLVELVEKQNARLDVKEK